MSNDVRRDSDQKPDDRDQSRRREIDERTSHSVQKLGAREARATDAPKVKGPPDSLPKLTTKEHLQRLDRIAERSSARHLPDFDPARQQRLEDIEIRTSPVAFLRRQDHAGLDRGTVKLLRHSLEAHGVHGPDDLRNHRLDDTWGIWDGTRE